MVAVVATHVHSRHCEELIRHQRHLIVGRAGIHLEDGDLTRAVLQAVLSMQPLRPQLRSWLRAFLDAEGQVVDTTVTRAKIRSVAKLAYDDVSDYYAGRATPATAISA